MSSGAHSFLAFLLVAATLSACTPVVEVQPVPVRQQICTREFAPVCGRRGSQQRTFNNSCLARASGFQVMHRGQCRMSVSPPIGGPPFACTREFAPVCGRRGGQQRTFDNSCLARASGFQVMHRGQCRMSVPPPPFGGRPTVCTREFRPVCAVRGNRTRTFDNACLARSSGFRPISQGRCF
ncbi:MULTISPECIES: Kazal-type serine protease inhibitor domain-containing protein [unclassified Sinorhizobium]|uniref:Kazal-type serine protease inhibitor domain-containing protein n=1 Tax=unclassified Sinorhizobium TaxID=2613772 RepID=UPI003526B271